MKTVSSRHILFLVGMHRSGTSALCAALRACGSSFGDRLLEPLEGVNDQGFWESVEVVDLNDRLLNLAGADWYSVTSQHLGLDWSGPQFESERDAATRILQHGFGSGPLEVVKDPRFCITLGFWLARCRDMGLPASVCVMTREPLEVCRSLEKRDGFPLGYGIRLLRNYLLGVASSVPPGTFHATYERLLEDPVALMRDLQKSLPLVVDEDALASAVQLRMKHQTASEDEAVTALQDYPAIDFEALDAQLETLYPAELTLARLASNLVDRGRELTRIGAAHTLALQTVERRDAELGKLSGELEHAIDTVELRDAQIRDTLQRLEELGQLRSRELEKLEELGASHTRALTTIRERDDQLADFDRRLQEIGDLHTKALQVIEERDRQLVDFQKKGEQLQRIFRKPGVGVIFRAMWKYETR